LNRLYWGCTRLIIQVVLLLAVVIPGIFLVQLFLHAPGVFIIIGIVGMIGHFSTVKTGGWEYGTARWATLRDLIRGGYLQHREGMIVGRVDPRFTSGRNALWTSFDTLFAWTLSAEMACRMAKSLAVKSHWSRELIVIPEQEIIHAAIYAPTGQGKTHGHAIINLFTDRANAVVFDFKGGEILRATGLHRQRKFGHKIVTIDMFGLAPPPFHSGAFNPLSVVALDSPLAISDAQHFAKALIQKDQHDNNPFFGNAAEMHANGIFSFLFAHAVPSDVTLTKLREITCDPELLDQTINLMRKSTAQGGHIRRKGNQLATLEGKTRQDVLATLHTKLSFLDNPLVEEATNCTTFDPMELIHGRMSLYIIYSPDRVEELSPLLRVQLTGLLHLLFGAGEDRHRRVRFYLDEASLLGKDLPMLERFLTKGRSYGLRSYWYWQSPQQVKEVFPDHQAQVFRDNMSAELFMGINSVETATEVSKWIGRQTITTKSHQNSSSVSHQGSSMGEPMTYSTSNSTTEQAAGRDLIQPEELLQLDDEATVILKPRTRPIVARSLRDFRMEDRIQIETVDAEEQYKVRCQLSGRRYLSSPVRFLLAIGCCVFAFGAMILTRLYNDWTLLPEEVRIQRPFHVWLQEGAERAQTALIPSFQAMAQKFFNPATTDTSVAPGDGSLPINRPVVPFQRPRNLRPVTPAAPRFRSSRHYPR
jgi:type IV secretion system protein VirD4